MKTKLRVSFPHLIVIALLLLIAALLIVLARPVLPIGITRENIENIEEVGRLGDGWIFKGVWSADGKRLALVGSVGIRIIDLDDIDAPAQWLDEHTGFVSDAAFSPDGALLASGGEDALIHLWDTQTWQVIATLKGHETDIQDVVFTPDGRKLVSTDKYGEMPIIRVWDVETRTEIVTMTHFSSTRSIDALAISPDSRLLATESSDEMHVWRLADGKDLGTPRPQNPSRGDRVIFTQDGQWLILGGYSLAKSVTEGVWWVDGETFVPAVVSDEEGLPTFIRDETVDAYLELDSSMLETVPALPADQVKVWAELDQRSRSNERSEQRLFADPTGQMMLVIWSDRTELWDVTEPTLKTVLHSSLASFQQVAASPDGGSVAGMAGYNVEMWDIAKEVSQTSLDFLGAGGYLHSIFWQQESFRGLFMNDTGGGRWLDLPTSSALYTIEAVYEPIYSDDGKYMATRGNDWAMVIYNLETGEKISSFVPSPMDTQVTYAPLAFSPDGRILVNQVRERECSCSVVSLWDTATGQKIIELGEFNRYAHSAAFTSNGATLILGGGGYTENHDGGSIEIWDVATGTRLKRFDGFDLAVQQLAISSDNRFVAGIAYGEIHLWDLTADNEAGRLLIKGGGSTSDGFSMALFNPRGDMLFVASEWGDIPVFDVETGENIKILQGHSRHANDLLFVDEGRTLLSTGSDGTVRFWSEPGNAPDLSAPVEQPAVPTIAMTPTVGMQ